MTSLLTRFMTLPMPVRAGLVVVSGGGLMMAVFVLAQGSNAAMFALVTGLAVIAALAAAWKLVQKKRAGKKAKPLERDLAGNAAAAPSGVSEPAKRAALDDLRKRFDEGVEKFRDAGKNIYSLPWYLLVGEPGSGKTEAIRHSNVPRPRGLQDELQGVGGTLNMNWWFTNHAIILDTAGRLMFEEVDPGATSEWTEFLKMLRRNRPRCPINGLLLVVPADSLIRDTADSIQRKAGKIAERLDGIQRALGVRFPVFVVVTKCDLINGFREFFEHLSGTDPDTQHQMLGWSNPAELDEAFDPERVDEHLQTVRERLSRRRTGLLLDPVHSEDPAKRRLDEVDALYDFPDAFTQIGPRLRRYMEAIFTPGEWSSKPLFLRGIYFTSSMREGDALDSAIAEAIGVPVESLPEGRVWKRELALFLRDLFEKKVFKERGLVTRVSNTKKALRKRRAIVWGTAGFGTLLVAAFTWIGWNQLDRDVARPTRFWSGAIEAFGRGETSVDQSEGNVFFRPIVSTEFVGGPSGYNGGGSTPFEEVVGYSRAKPWTIAGFPLTLRDRAREAVRAPWVFKPVAFVTEGFTTDLSKSERLSAAGTLFELSVVGPAIESARVRLGRLLADEEAAWTPAATEALGALLSMEVAGLQDAKDRDPSDVLALLRFALDGDSEALAGLERDRQQIEAMVEWTYGEGDRAWPAPWMTGDLSQLETGVNRFIDSWDGEKQKLDDALARAENLVSDLESLKEAEASLHLLSSGLSSGAMEVDGRWAARMAGVESAAADVESSLEAFALGERSLDRAFEDAMQDRRDRVIRSHELVRKALDAVVKIEDATRPEVRAGSGDDEVRHRQLGEMHVLLEQSVERLEDSLDARVEALGDDVKELGTLMFASSSPEGYAFRGRLGQYRLADAQIRPADPAAPSTFGQIGTALTSVDERAATATTHAEEPLAARPRGAGEQDAEEFNDTARAVSIRGIEFGRRKWSGLYISAFLDLVESEGGLNAAVARHAVGRGLTLERPDLPLLQTSRSLEPSLKLAFHPEAARDLLSDMLGVIQAFEAQVERRPLGAQTSAARVSSARLACVSYVDAYLGYWTTTLMTEELRVNPALTWAQLNESISSLNAEAINRGFREVSQHLADAREKLRGVLDPSDPTRFSVGLAALERVIASTAETRVDPLFATRCAQLLMSWQGVIADDPVLARAALLRGASADPGKFVYWVPPGSAADPLESYWQDLSARFLESLGAAYGLEATRSLTTLENARVFPLAPPTFPIAGPAGASQQLDPDALEGLRAAIAVVGQPDAVPAPGAVQGLPTRQRNAYSALITPAGSTGLAEQFDRVLASLAAPGMPGLAPGQEPRLRCSVAILDREKANGDNELGRKFRRAALTQGERDEASVATRAPVAGRARCGTVDYPGEGVELKFWVDEAVGEPDATLKVVGPWAPLRLLHPGRLGEPTASAMIPEGSDGKVWEVEVLLPHDGEILSLWLELTFEKALPSLESWPGALGG